MASLIERFRYVCGFGKQYMERALIRYKQRRASPTVVDRLVLLEDSVRRCFYGLLRANLATDFMSPKPSVCPVCGGELGVGAREIHADCMFTSAPLRRFRCDHCGTIFGPVSLIECVPEHLSDLYTILYRYYKEGETDQYQERAFFAMQPEKGKKYLNFACGTWSSGIARLRAMGFDIYGYEPSLNKQHPGIFTSLEEVANAGPFDGVFTHNFIEHVQSPRSFFAQIRSLTNSNAKVAHSSACFDYRYEKSPFHLFFLSHAALQILADFAEHKIIDRTDRDLDLPGREATIYIFQITQSLGAEGCGK